MEMVWTVIGCVAGLTRWFAAADVPGRFFSGEVAHRVLFVQGIERMSDVWHRIGTSV
jgi:hypothetical protein